VKTGYGCLGTAFRLQKLGIKTFLLNHLLRIWT